MGLASTGWKRVRDNAVAKLAPQRWGQGFSVGELLAVIEKPVSWIAKVDKEEHSDG